jgi:hypothetical protein
MKLLDMLEELHNSIRHMFDVCSLNLLPDKTIDSLNNLDYDDDDADLELPDEDVSINSLEKDFKYTDYQKVKASWECSESQNNDIPESDVDKRIIPDYTLVTCS